MSTLATTVPTFKLNSGYEMPQIGLGVWQSTGGDEVDAVLAALEIGYRHVDTAAIYKNEEGVGKALAQTDVPREDIFLTTKLWNDDIRAGNAREAFETSLAKLKLDYVDLYLLHWPVQGGIAAYREMEKLHSEGLIRSLGLSNYMPEHIRELRDATDVVPAVDQIEFHPRNQQNDVLDYCAQEGIRVTAWSPLMQANFDDAPGLSEIGERYGKSPAQVLLRWDLQRGVITIPKSVHRNRIQENFELFDFELSAADMQRLDALDAPGGRYGPDPRNHRE